MGKDALCLCSHCIALWLAISYLPLGACLLYFSHSGLWGFVNVNALKHLSGEKCSQKNGAVLNESILWILPFLSLSVINNTPQAVCYLECWVVSCSHMGFLWNVSQIHWEDPTGSKLPVLCAEHSPGVLTGGQTTARSLHPASKCNLQACESRARACKRLGACTELFLHTLHPPAHTGRQAPQVGDTRLWEDAASFLYPAALTGRLCLSLVKSPGRRLVWFLSNTSVSGRRAQGVLWTGWGGSALLVGEGGCPVFLKTIDMSEYCWKDLAFWIRQSKFILWKIYPEGQGPLGIYSYRSL